MLVPVSERGLASVGPGAVEGSFSPGDPAGEAVDAIVRLVCADDWVFVGCPGPGRGEYVVAAHGVMPPGLGRPRHHRSRRRGVWTIPADGRFFGSGVAVGFGDDRALYGTLRLFRRAGREPFSPTELRLLGFAHESFSSRMSRLRLLRQQPAGTVAAARPESWAQRRTDESALYIVDRELRIVLGPPPLEGEEPWPAEASVEPRLPSALERIVRELARELDEAPPGERVAVAQPAPFMSVRAEPLHGRCSEQYIAVHMKAFGERDALRGAAKEFHISPREMETLLLLMDGLTVSEMGERLSIATSTIQDHIKSLLDKTQSTNRAAMVARVLGWAAPHDILAAHGDETLSPAP